jgi:hypothetical protein
MDCFCDRMARRVTRRVTRWGVTRWGIAGWIALCSNLLFARIEWRLIARVTRMDRQAFSESSLVCLEHLEAGGTKTLSTGVSFAICALGNAA